MNNEIITPEVNIALNFLYEFIYEFERGGIYEDNLDKISNALKYAQILIDSKERQCDELIRIISTISNTNDTLNKENAELRKLLSKNKFKELQYKIQRWCRG